MGLNEFLHFCIVISPFICISVLGFSFVYCIYFLLCLYEFCKVAESQKLLIRFVSYRQCQSVIFECICSAMNETELSVNKLDVEKTN